MKTVTVCLAAALLGIGALVARADHHLTPETVVIGPVRCFIVRVQSAEGTPHQRVNQVHDVFAKHLGGRYGAFTNRAVGSRTHIYLNGDFVIAVWQADATATGYKSTAQLASVWTSRLRAAFAAGHGGSVAPAIP